MCPRRMHNTFNSTFLYTVDKVSCNNHQANLTSNNITLSIRESFYTSEVNEKDLLRITGSLQCEKSAGIDISPF